MTDEEKKQNYLLSKDLEKKAILQFYENMKDDELLSFQFAEKMKKIKLQR